MIGANPLLKYPLFEGLNESELDQLADYLAKRTFARGAYLYYPGTPASNVYLVESGLVRLFFSDASGREFIVNLVGPLSMVGLPYLHKDQVRLAGAAALQPSVVLSLSVDDMGVFMRTSPQFMLNFYREMDTSIRMLFMYTQALVTKSLLGRLAGLLLYLSGWDKSQEVGDEIDMPLSQAEIASWLGASRGRLNRGLNKLQQAGLIQVNGQKVLIFDRPALERIAES